MDRSIFRRATRLIACTVALSAGLAQAAPLEPTKAATTKQQIGATPVQHARDLGGSKSPMIQTLPDYGLPSQDLEDLPLPDPSRLFPESTCPDFDGQPRCIYVVHHTTHGGTGDQESALNIDARNFSALTANVETILIGENGVSVFAENRPIARGWSERLLPTNDATTAGRLQTAIIVSDTKLRITGSVELYEVLRNDYPNVPGYPGLPGFPDLGGFGGFPSPGGFPSFPSEDDDPVFPSVRTPGNGFGGLGAPTPDVVEHDYFEDAGLYEYRDVGHAEFYTPILPIEPAPEDRSAPLLTREISAIHDAPVTQIDCSDFGAADGAEWLCALVDAAM